MTLNTKTLRIPIGDTDYFSALMKSYVEENMELKPFYHRFPKMENFGSQIEEKKDNYSSQQREVLVQAIENQYRSYNLGEEVSHNLKLLAQENSYTITTGHQLNIFTGPLYFWYKILNTIKLCKELKESYADYNFIPIYWMASEDHDFDEINFFNYKGHKIAWNHAQGPAVGDLDLVGMDAVLKELESLSGKSKNSQELLRLFRKCYLEENNLAAAMRRLVHELFSDLGLIIIDGNDAELKRLFLPIMQDDLAKHSASKEVNRTNESLAKIGKIQVNPREINLFYLGAKERTRIVRTGEGYESANQEQTWSSASIFEELEKFPERFSPNVVLRPLYQELILPNLCYIGGGGEIAYWLELKSMFEYYKVAFPILLLRNSILVATDKQVEKSVKLGMEPKDLLKTKSNLVDYMLPQYSNQNWNFNSQMELLKSQFKEMYQIAEQTDASFKGAVAAQEQKQINGLKHLEKRLKRAEKKRLYEKITRLESLQEQLAPNNSLEERQRNFSLYYEQYGSSFRDVIYDAIRPLAMEFSIVVMEN